MQKKYNLYTFLVAFLLCLVLTSCTSVRVQGTRATPTVTLRSLAQSRHFLFGTAVNVDALQGDTQYANILGQEFNIVTPENAMKFDATNPQPGVFTFQQGDTLVAFARTHGMQVRGHNLVWYRALPDWVAQGKFSRSQLLAIMKEHIPKLAYKALLQALMNAKKS